MRIRGFLGFFLLTQRTFRHPCSGKWCKIDFDDVKYIKDSLSYPIHTTKVRSPNFWTNSVYGRELFIITIALQLHCLWIKKAWDFVTKLLLLFSFHNQLLNVYLISICSLKCHFRMEAPLVREEDILSRSSTKENLRNIQKLWKTCSLNVFGWERFFVWLTDWEAMKWIYVHHYN